MSEIDALRERVAFLERELEAAHKTRALFYAAMFDELARRLGEAEAEAIMSAVTYRRGTEIGRRFARFAPADLAGLCRAFIDFVPDRGRLFDPEVRRCDESELVIHMRRCPLKEAWLEAGLPPERVATLCRIAGRIDDGTFEGAGFAFAGTTWRPGETGCCTLAIRPRTGAQR
ncbi:MAG: L-2-amino-thiazoline-4-carboxylic acid hydrolase [Geminicoccaceae bacterium]|nr:L-2-amino-thiazoline-4-carboxylic acid hydrolase [Geminicoccaceae bacterium]MDW8341926.1 L-2-amino-thiazoline-4-carboxylic acid hydrolase [Geminicoccaceae bacterium]